MLSSNCIEELKNNFEGEVYADDSIRWAYATDASAYREKPQLVTIPKNINDLKCIIAFAHKENTTIIPRTAGTSLAGQVVGNGVIVDVSKYFTQILELNVKEKWVRVQPGIVLDELNQFLAPYNLFFGPETSTANRCMIGGMVGNNACGSHSLIYGSTRDHLLALKVLLSDGTEATFEQQSKSVFTSSNDQILLSSIYSHLNKISQDPQKLATIQNDFPKPGIKRRNTGYAIDELVNKSFLGGKNDRDANICDLLAGSEGTLALTTEIKLNLVDTPPPITGLICAHFDSLEEAIEGNLIALKHHPGAIELIDDVILTCTKDHPSHDENRFFIEGEPKAILLIEFKAHSDESIRSKYQAVLDAFNEAKYGYAFPLVTGNDIKKVWKLRKDSLGLLSNIPGDAKPVSLVEDTAVLPEDLPQYISAFKKIMSKYQLNCVYHAHISTGELHLRPVINLKTKTGVELFRKVGLEVAQLVKKYRGALSGEHGDGRLRGEFLSVALSHDAEKLMQEIKAVWDPKGIFNNHKIVESKPMDVDLRYDPSKIENEPQTILDFSNTGGYFRMAEQCTGSAVCRKSHLIGGTMCPTYMATKDEDKTTRSRANLLREYLTKSAIDKKFDNNEIYKSLELCISCKGCKKECPSNVDMALLKAEFLYQYQLKNGVAFSDRIQANYASLSKKSYPFRSVLNLINSTPLISNMIKHFLDIHPQRSLPKYSKRSLRSWTDHNIEKLNSEIKDIKQEVYFFIDEFTNFTDAEIGIKAIKLLTHLGIKVHIIDHEESARSLISKGFLVEAKQVARKNVNVFLGKIGVNKPLIGIEPSAILTFKDEYPKLLRGQDQTNAKTIAGHTFLMEDFLAEFFKKHDLQDAFIESLKHIVYHGHCHQKSIVGVKAVEYILSYPANHHVRILNTGCCGMAGAFGYSKKHFELSQKIGELQLFPSIDQMQSHEILSASGTSCRHQVKDRKNIRSFHPIEILYSSLKM